MVFARSVNNPNQTSTHVPGGILSPYRALPELNDRVASLARGYLWMVRILQEAISFAPLKVDNVSTVEKWRTMETVENSRRYLPLGV